MKDRPFLAPVSRLLLRHLPENISRNRVILGFPKDDLMTILWSRFGKDMITGYHWDLSAIPGSRRFTDSPEEENVQQIQYGVRYAPSKAPDEAVLLATGNHRRTAMLLEMLAGVLPNGATVYLVGENRAGVRTAKRSLESTVRPVVETHSGNHCTLYRAECAADTSLSFDLERWKNTFIATVNGISLTVAGYPGVFSAEHLDDGTRFLLENLELQPGNRILEIGCGTGVVGAYSRLAQPVTTVTMTDVDAFALQAAKETIAANATTDVTILASDGFSRIGGTYDHIICNPPFHKGTALDRNLAIAGSWIRDAYRCLVPDGRLTIAGNAFLPYGGLMKTIFPEVRRVATNRQFTVWEGVRDAGV